MLQKDRETENEALLGSIRYNCGLLFAVRTDSS